MLSNWIHPLLFAGGAVWTPLDIEGCVLWLDANQIAGFDDTDPLGVWQDMSGLANDAAEVANPPTYRTGIQNGLPIVRFNGVQRLTVTSFATNNFGGITQMTSFVVYNPRGDAGYNVLDCGTVGQHWRFADGGFYNSYFRTARTVNDPPNQPNDTNFHFHTLRSGPANAYDVFRDGLLDAEYPQNWGVASDDLIIANGGDAGGLAGDIAEIIIYARELTYAEITTVQDFLVAKWNLADLYRDYIVWDFFLDANGTLIHNHPPNKDLVGGGWVSRAGAPQIQSNTLEGSGLTRFSIDVGTPYQLLETKMLAEGSYMRCELRWTDANNKLGVLIRDDINNVSVYRYRGAGAESIGGCAYAFTTGVWYDILIRYGVDGRVVVEIDGNPCCDVDEGNLVPSATNIHFEMPNVVPSWALDDLGVTAAL